MEAAFSFCSRTKLIKPLSSTAPTMKKIRLTTLVIRINQIGMLFFFLGMMSRYIPPDYFFPLQLFDLALIPFMLFALGISIFWLFKERKLAVMNFIWLLGMLWSFQSHYAILNSKSDEKADLKVLTFNVAQFNGDPKNVSQTAAQLQKEGADIVLLQEFGLFPGWKINDTLLENMAQRTGYPYFEFNKEPNNIFGLAVLSKYPILNSKEIFLPISFTNGGVLYEIQTPQRQIGLINFHLQSFNIFELKEKKKSWLARVKNVYSSSYWVFEEQMSQTQLIRKEVDAAGLPIILGGDLNNGPSTYIYRLMASGLKDSFAEKGQGWSTTFEKGWLSLRLDYLLSSPEFKVISHRILPQGHSDHHPVVAEYKL